MVQYKIVKDRTRRQDERPSGIVLMHSLNLINKDYIIPAFVRHSTDSPSWVTWQDYLLNKVGPHTNGYYSKTRLPMHYFEEYLESDYVVYKGLNEYKESWFLSQMVNYGIIESQFKDALLIVIDDNFETDMIRQRVYDQLVQKVLDEIMHHWHFTVNDIYYYDEILTNKAFDNMENNPDFTFEYHPMLNYDFTKLKLAVDRLHWKYIGTKKY